MLPQHNTHSSLNFLEFVGNRNGYPCERVNIAEARLFACNGLCGGEKKFRSSASADALQIVIN
jgi:hypothetical protein